MRAALLFLAYIAAGSFLSALCVYVFGKIMGAF
jgi:hypothetical protein